MESNVETIAADVWKELEEASRVEAPLNIKPFYDDMIKREDPATKVLADFKKPSEITLDEFKSLPAKYNWSSHVKFSLYSINKFSADLPIRLCHLLMVLAWRLKIFGDDAFGKVSARCKVGASIVNHLIEKNSVFYPGGPARARLPVSLRPLNDETFKAAVIELTKCTSDTNLQRYYVGDGEGDPTLAGLGVPPMALTSGSSPGAEILFKRSLHEVKGLLESQAYLKNPAAADIAAARQQAVVLDGIARVLNGQPASYDASNSVAVQSTSRSSGSSEVTNPGGARNTTPSPTSEDSTIDERKKKKSPAVSMADAAVMSQEASLLEAKNFQAIVDLQREEMKLREARQHEEMEMRKTDAALQHDERKQTTVVLQKIIDKLCPELDPTERYVERKRKLDEMRVVLGEELYEARLSQLKDAFLKSSAM